MPSENTFCKCFVDVPVKTALSSWDDRGRSWDKFWTLGTDWECLASKQLILIKFSAYLLLFGGATSRERPLLYRATVLYGLVMPQHFSELFL